MATNEHVLIALVAMAGIGALAALAILPAGGQFGDQILERAGNLSASGSQKLNFSV